MKTKRFLSLALALLMLLGCMTVTSFADGAKQLTVNDGTVANERIPFYGLFCNENTMHTQFIQPADAIQAMDGAEITKMTFYVQTGSANATFEVRLMGVAQSVFDTATLLDTTDATLVYSGVVSVVGGKVEISFATPFEYEASVGGVQQNLLIDFTLTEAGSYQNTKFYGVSVSGNSSLIRYSQTPGNYQKFLPKITFDYVTPTYLDLDTNTKKDIDTNYTFTQKSESYTDVTKVKLDWTIHDIAATYKSHKTWDPDTMTWVEAKENISVTNDAATFTLTNYSSKAISAKAEFAVEDALKDTFTSAQFDENNGKTIDTVVNADYSIDETKKTNVPSNTITATLTLDKDQFAKLNATTSSSKYGTYTVTLTEVIPNITFSELTYNPLGVTIVESNIVLKGSTWEEVVANNANNTLVVKYSYTQFTCQLVCNDDAVYLSIVGGTRIIPLYVKDSSTGLPGSANVLKKTDDVRRALYFYISR